ncbi:MAG: hypothetical protein FJ087_20870, partial [Deltaproteobacteria bacterium]|nr:hypothetical protein [Deltaproteobacteria bacterium]
MTTDPDTGAPPACRPAARTAGDLAQPGCSMTGFAAWLARLDADVAVVLFGERDCANAFARLEPEFLALPRWRFYTTALRETDVVAGAAEARLEQCLRAVVAAGRSRALAARGPCTTEMIGADPGPVCEAVAAETGASILPVRTSGLKPVTQAAVADEVADLLLRVFHEPHARDPDAVSLVGLATWPSRDAGGTRTLCLEAAEVLRRIGLRLGAAVPAGATAEDWRSLPRAVTAVAPDLAVFPKLARRMRWFGMRLREVPAPSGVEWTDRFYAAIGAMTKRDAVAATAALPARAAAVPALWRARSRIGGRRLAYGIGSHHDFRPELLAREGLCDLPLLLELGFKIEVLIQERDRPEVHKRVRRNLDALGVDLPYRLFHEPAALAPVLAAGRFDLAYLAPFLADQAATAGVPTLAPP